MRFLTIWVHSQFSAYPQQPFTPNYIFKYFKTTRTQHSMCQSVSFDSLGWGWGLWWGRVRGSRFVVYLWGACRERHTAWRADAPAPTQGPGGGDGGGRHHVRLQGLRTAVGQSDRRPSNPQVPLHSDHFFPRNILVYLLSFPLPPFPVVFIVFPTHRHKSYFLDVHPEGVCGPMTRVTNISVLRTQGDSVLRIGQHFYMGDESRSR